MPSPSATADLTGKVIMITGATAGIGKEAALALAGMGADLVLVCRSRDKAGAVQRDIAALGRGRVDIVLADLSSMDQVRAAAAEFLAMGRPLHGLLNNAGVLLLHRQLTVDGFEATMATNHLAPFLLTNLLLERLEASAPARIVTVASRAHRMSGGRLCLDDLHGERGYHGWRAYARSKLANILFTRELARRLAGTQVTANCVHPGVVATSFARNNGMLARLLVTVGRPFMISAAQGARTSIYLCASPEVEGVSGMYFDACVAVEPRSQARNDDDARALWELSARLTGLAGGGGAAAP